MPTALQLITRSMRLAGAIGKGETADDDEAADGLTALNAMLDSWQLERLMVYQITQGSYTWPAATTSRSIGSGGNFSAQRPVKIDSAFIRDSSNNDLNLVVLEDRQQYDGIVTKSTQSTLPQWIFMDPIYPLAVLYLYPVPSGQLTLKLNTWQTLQSFTALTTDLALPPGYERAIVYNFALEFAPEFGSGRKIDPQVPLIASQSKAAIKTINQPSMVAQLDTAAANLSSGGRWNIYADR